MNLVLRRKSYKPALDWISNENLASWVIKNYKRLPPVDDRLVELMDINRGTCTTTLSLSPKVFQKSYTLRLRNIDTSLEALLSYPPFCQLILKVNLRQITPFQKYYWKASRIHASHFYYYRQLFSFLVVLQKSQRIEHFVAGMRNYHMCGYFFEKLAQTRFFDQTNLMCNGIGVALLTTKKEMFFMVLRLVTKYTGRRVSRILVMLRTQYRQFSKIKTGSIDDKRRHELLNEAEQNVFPRPRIYKVLRRRCVYEVAYAKWFTEEGSATKFGFWIGPHDFNVMQRYAAKLRFRLALKE